MYVHRDQDGKITGRYTVAQEEGQEYLPDDSSELALLNTQNAKREEIRNAYSTAVTAPQTVGGITYHGGFESVIRLDAAKRLAEDLSQSDVTLFDVDNVGHTLSIADATEVIQTLGQQTQTDFAKKQGLLVDIENAANSATADGIAW